MRDPLAGTSIKYKLTASFVGICLAAFGVGGYMVSTFARETLEREIMLRLEAQARGVATQLDASLESLGRRAEDFASDGFVRAELERVLADPAERERVPADSAAQGTVRELAAHLAENKLPLIAALAGIAVCDTQGMPLVCVQSVGSTAVLPAHAGAARMQSYEGGFMLQTPIRSLRGSRRIGNLVFHVDAAAWMRGLVLPGGSGTSSSSTAIWVLSDPTGATFTMNGEDEEGAGDAHRSTWVQPLTAEGWSVQVSLDPTEAMEAVTGLQSGFLGAGLLFAAAAIVLMFFPIRFLVQPLGVMRDAARRMSLGDYSVRVPEQADDEIGDLAHAFNTMAAATQERTVSLEHTAAMLDRKSRELRLERDMLDSVMRAMHDGVVSLDRRGTVVLHNAAAASLAEALRAGHGTIHPFRCTGDGHECLDCLLHPGPDPLTCTIEHEEAIYEILSTPVGAHGSVHGRILVARDVTERLRIGALEAHRERLALVGEISAAMAHELNNPLAAISIYAQMMHDDLGDEAPHREHVDVILRNTEMCSRAVRGLLDHARGAQVDIGEVDLTVTVDEALRLVLPMAERNGITFHTTADRAACIVHTDEALVRQVLVNLLFNAVQALESDGGLVHLDVSAAAGDGCVVRVIDDGPGLPDAWHARVFEPFFTTKPAGKGTGLGLPTARRIAEALGGALVLEESTCGRTVFRLELPRVTRPIPAIHRFTAAMEAAIDA